MKETLCFKEHVKLFSGEKCWLVPNFARTQIRHSPTISFLSSLQTFRVRNEQCGVNKPIEDKPVVFNLTLSQMKKTRIGERKERQSSTMPVSRTREDLEALAASPRLPRLRQRNDLV